MIKFLKNLGLLAAILLISSCVSLSRSEKQRIKELKSYGIDKESEAIKNPTTAALLNILPGGGNFYLASGSGETEQWIIGGLNLITWPWSIVWGVPEAAIDASTINQKATLDYYQFDKEGKAHLEKLRSGKIK